MTSVVVLALRHVLWWNGGRVSPTQQPPSGVHCCWRLSRPQAHRAAGMMKSMKNSNDRIGNRTRDLLAFRTARQLRHRLSCWWV